MSNVHMAGCDLFVGWCWLWGRCCVFADLKVAWGFCVLGFVCGLCIVCVHLWLWLGGMSM